MANTVFNKEVLKDFDEYIHNLFPLDVAVKHINLIVDSKWVRSCDSIYSEFDMAVMFAIEAERLNKVTVDCYFVTDEDNYNRFNWAVRAS